MVSINCDEGFPNLGVDETWALANGVGGILPEVYLAGLGVVGECLAG